MVLKFQQLHRSTTVISLLTQMEVGLTGAALILSLLFYSMTIAQPLQEHCGTIGTFDNRAATPSGTQLFYLNTVNPAPCTGNVTSWRVCYYGPASINPIGSYWATYAVYRRMGSGSNTRYMRVSELFSAIRTVPLFTDTPIVDGEIAQGGFNCYDDIPANSSLTIQAGDILGACVFDPDGDIPFIVTRVPLDVVGVASGGSLLQMNTDGCSRQDLPSNIPANQLSTLASRRLHIYANIVGQSNVKTTTMPPPPTTAAATTTTTPIPPTTDAQISLTTKGVALIVTTEHRTTAMNPRVLALTTEEVDSSAMEHTLTPLTTTRETSSTTGAGISPSLMLAVGIIVGALLLVFLGVAVVAALLCLVKRRKTGRETQVKACYGVNNANYEESSRVNECRGNGFNAARAYEVPVNAMPVHAVRTSEHCMPMRMHEALYEYTTSGPDEQEPATYEHSYFTLEEATRMYSQLLQKNIQEDIYGDLEEYLQPAIGEGELYEQISACGITNISSEFIQIQGHLGSGQFGSVEQGVWRNGLRDIEVAVKLLKEEASEIDKVKFLQEAAIMAQFTHPNVVSLYGVVSKTEPIMLVVELVEKGDLKNHLYTMRPDPGELPTANMIEILLNFSQQVAFGMHYLSAKRFIHRDLAARNILVSRDNLCKVADFGMSRDLADGNYYLSQGGKIPIKWTAPEAIHYKKYSTASDVWSYGCLLYEIWSLGYKPFEGVGNERVIELVGQGKRLSPPPGCSRVIYELMIKCWNPVAGQRPSFRDLLLALLDNLKEVLSIPQEDLDTHSHAGVLGSLLEAGEHMYRDLQDRYQ